ncbi:MAG: hypothetical protein RLY16_319 [Bacteroidota bacterium]|jgi:hypothetical protein
MNIKEIFFSILVLSTLIVIGLYSLWRKDEINKNAAFTIAKVVSVQDTENAPIYNLEYFVNDIHYKSHYKGFIKMYDSLVFIKISLLKPEIFTYSDEAIPNCLTIPDSMNRVWTTLPQCH